MLQNNLLFNQSSVSLEIIGLPDYSNNEKKDQISIISQWKLKITDKPLIEGNIDHLISVMAAFYNYSNFLINNQIPIYESQLIDIKADNFYTHNILLKSSKANVEPLKIIIGNSVLSDIINCFDQFNSSPKIRKISANLNLKTKKNSIFTILNKDKIANLFLPPLISLFTIFLVSSAFSYFYYIQEDNEKKSFNNSQKSFNSAKSINTIV